MSKLKHPANRGKQNKYYKYVHKLLNDWKIENNITARCDVHHRDDTMECINYNNEHYNLWGCEVDENGNCSFTLGKYVLFMTCAEHARYHGAHVSEKKRKKLSQTSKGRKLSEAARKKMSDLKKGEKNPMFGKTLTEEHKQKIIEANKKCFQEMHKKVCEKIRMMSELYEQYKNNGGTLVWNDFQRAFKNNEIDIDRLKIKNSLSNY